MVVQLKKACEASVRIDAPVKDVWALVSDVTRTGEWSVECRGAEWLGGATVAEPGATFRGRNRRGATRWSRICEVLVAEPPRLFVWRTVPTRLLPDSTRWEFELEPTDTGTVLTERMKVLKITKLYDVMFATMLPQHRDRTADLEADLQRIKEHVEAAGN